MREHRIHPRLQTKLEATLVNPQGFSHDATVRNISPGGLMLDGGLELKEKLVETEHKLSSNAMAEVVISIKLPDGSPSINSRCRLVYVRRLSQNAFNFGFRFTGFDADGADHLQRYFDQQIIKQA